MKTISMKGKKQYYGLDEVGFLGMQGQRTGTQNKKDIEQTIQYIKDKKARSSRLKKSSLKQK